VDFLTADSGVGKETICLDICLTVIHTAGEDLRYACRF
jgi:hypothetical protein